MAQNITLLGANYSAVPAVLLPKTGGGTARFDDASVTTAVASDVTQGKIFLNSSGQITTGTNSGGGGTGGAYQDENGYVVLNDDGGGVAVTPLSVTSNGTYTAPTGSAYSPVTVNVGGGGGGTLVYEKGELVVSSQQYGATFPFANQHSEPPVFFCIVRDCTNISYTNYSSGEMGLVGGLFTEILGVGSIETKASSPYHAVGLVSDYRRSTSSMSVYGVYTTNDAATRWDTYATEEGLLIPSTLEVGAGTYKWFAIWKTWE